MIRSRFAVLAGVTILAAACGGEAGQASDAPAAADGAVDARPDGGPFVPGGAFTPATIRFHPGFDTATFLPCELDGQPVDYGARVVVDDCVECQCTTYGLRCRKRATCADDRCVFADGQVVPVGGGAIVETCFECTCDATGPACRRRVDAPCPADGCKLGGSEIGLGVERFVSECHACTCDEAAGLLCEDLCHPECFCDEDVPGCTAVCDAVTCPVAIPDQDRIDLPCGSPVCDYGDLVGAPACL